MLRRPFLFVPWCFVLVCGAASAPPDYFTLSPIGCAGVHCTKQEDDLSGMVPPLTAPGLMFQDLSINSSGSGRLLGASGNGSVVAALYATENSNGRMYVYDADGNLLWTDQTSGMSALGAGGCAAPVVGTDGGVINADYNYIYRWDGAGKLLWKASLPYAGVASVNNSSGNYVCGGIKVLPTAVVVKTLQGPLAALDSSTGLVLGPAGCVKAACALWPGMAASPGGFSPHASYYINVKEGGCAEGSRIYDAMHGAGGGLPTSQGILMAFDVDPVLGLRIGAQSATFPAESFASPMCTAVNGMMTVFSDMASCGPHPNCPVSGLNSAVMGWVDYGASLVNAPNFPVSTAVLTATSPQLHITGGRLNGKSVTFTVGGATTGCVAGQAANVTGNLAAYQGNWTITKGGVGAHSVTISFASATQNPAAGGTLQCNPGGSIQANFAVDPRAKCFWTYVHGASNLFCIDPATGATEMVLKTTAGFIPGEINLQSGSDRTMSVNPANGDSIMVSTLNGNSSWVVGIDVTVGRLLWAYLNGSSWQVNNAPGQFPILLSPDGSPEVTFTSSTQGLKILR